MREVHVVDGVSQEWVIGWKAAFASVTADLRTIRFKAVIKYSCTYGVEARAICRAPHRTHAAPDDQCRCGFNAWDSADLAVMYLYDHRAFLDKSASRFETSPPLGWSRSLTVLRVGLYGDVIEGTLDAGENWDKWGYRASDQLTTDVFFSGHCAACGDQARYIGATAKTSLMRSTLIPLNPLCVQHANRSEYILQPGSLSERNNVGIHLGFPSD